MIVSVENLVKRYKELAALDHMNLSIEEGEIFGLLGPNGSGKTTLIHCILSLLEYDKGTITVFGKEMRPDSYDLKRQVGVVMQNVAVFNELTVRENIDYFCGLYISDKKKRAQLVDEAVEFTGLQDFVKFYPKKLSGGLLRRLNIACGIAHKPRLIFMDEPTVAVDPQSRNSILEGIKKLNKDGATVIYTSHYMEEVEQICMRIGIIDKGRMIALGTKEELKSMIKTAETIKIETLDFPQDVLNELRAMTNVYSAEYAGTALTIRCSGGRNNLLRVLDFLKKKEVSFSHVYSELPTLNDVFLEITGKELRE